MDGSETRFAILLMTDIVGSTELKSRHGVPAYREALRVHNGHLELIARECDGIIIVQNLGDGYFLKAESIAEAVKFALLFQDAMREGPWPTLRLTSRVGIHAGEIATLENIIVAPAADLTSRVASLAVGGQILLTRLPFEEARHYLRDPALRWISHGDYLLKGQETPTEIFEVGVAGRAPLVAPPDVEKAKGVVLTGGPTERGGELKTEVAPEGNHQPQPLPVKRRVRKVIREFSLGLLALGFAFLCKLAIEQAAWGARADLWLSAQLQRAVAPWTSSRAGEVMLADLAGVPREPVSYPPLPGEMEPRRATPRKKLGDIIEAIAAQEPSVIAVDIDFSPWEDGRPATPEDPAFFERMLDTSKAHNVPIYLGVHRQRFREAREWLGAEKFSRLAAGMAVPSEPEASYYYVRWQWGYEIARPLANLALAAADKKSEAGQDAPARWAFQDAQKREAGSSRGKPLGMMSWARIDFSQLHELEDLSVASTATINNNGRKFVNRMVFIGDSSEPEHADHFSIDDPHPRPVAGIYLHACAALTALAGPLLDLTFAGRLALYSLVGMGTIGGLSILRNTSPRGMGVDSIRVVWCGIAIVGSCMLALFLVYYSRIMWTDFPALSTGLLLDLYRIRRVDPDMITGATGKDLNTTLAPTGKALPK